MQAEKHNKQLTTETDRAQIQGSDDQGRLGLAEGWLNIQSSMIRDMTRGLVFRVPGDGGNCVLKASWPGRFSVPAEFDQRVIHTAAHGKTQLEKIPGTDGFEPLIRLYHPFHLGEEQADCFVVVMEMNDRDKTERRTVANLLRWNCEWLKLMLSHESSDTRQTPFALFPMAASCLDQPEFRNTAMTLVTELAARYGCQRVSFGLRKRRHIEVQVLSHSSGFKHHTNLVQAIGAAMDEAIDQDKVIVYSAERSPSAIITRAHEELASHLAQGCVCTLPVTERGEVIGALTLERESNTLFATQDIHHIEQLLAIVAPVLLLKHRDEQSLPLKAWRSLGDNASRLFGPAHIRLKVASLAAVALVLFFSLVQGDWRVTAQALVEGSVQRTIAAPIDGYIATVAARAGDIVELGQEMGTLDDSDLTLQRLKWSTLRQQMVSESREAMAQHDRAEVSIINAKIEQADAELELLDEQLSRTRLLAPFDGIVIEGDLSQQLGTPVTRGEILFKVAPLDDYRIVLKVDEQDIAAVRAGQGGRLVLASMPDQVLQLQVDKITSVSTPGGGGNFFRVEASLTEAGLSLRPGMEGVGKLEVGEASLFWIWTHDLLNWLRLQIWTWWR